MLTINEAIINMIGKTIYFIANNTVCNFEISGINHEEFIDLRDIIKQEFKTLRFDDTWFFTEAEAKKHVV